MNPKPLAALAAALLLLLAPAASAQAALDAQQMLELLKTIDDRQRNSGDYRALVYLEQKEKDKLDTAREALVYRRDADDKLMILFTKPKGESGKGYLRLDKNLWSYDPNVGKWERRTERERIAGTDARRQDFDESRLADEYDATFNGEGKLGAFAV
ncbi:MAG TPA: outer membrane lipoprotein-sorting protein, partial [Aggregicoccus sp.]|nr:outer membrane lipoprotein-sorting protein [Aggregicoccus sp.]